MAMEQMKMPQLGESVTEGTISKWLVAPGDLVQKYEPIAEVITDKVNAEIPSSFTGIIQELIAKEDETLAVGEVICIIEAEESSTNQPVIKFLKITNLLWKIRSMKTRYSPAVLKLSQQHGIDLSKVNGSGKEGRITRKDLLSLIESNKAQNESMLKKYPIQNQIELKSTKQETINLPIIRVNVVILRFR